MLNTANHQRFMGMIDRDAYFFSLKHIYFGGLPSEVVGWNVRCSDMEEAHWLEQFPHNSMLGLGPFVQKVQRHDCQVWCKEHQAVQVEDRCQKVCWLQSIEVNGVPWLQCHSH